MGNMGKREQKSKSLAVDKGLLSDVIDYFIHQQGHLLMNMQSNRTDMEMRKKIVGLARQQFLLRSISEGEELEQYVEVFENYIWGYYLLDPLISDRTISDIKCYAYDRIRIKREGKREDADVKFSDEEDYRRFIQMAATKNEVNLSAINAKVKFTDYTSNEDFILRFNVCSGLLQTSRMPFMHIRKNPKKKLLLEDLEQKAFLTGEQKDYLKQKAVEASGIYITGKGSVGKSILLNALLEEIPRECSGLVIEESDELFSDHPDILLQHVIENNGEGKVSYGLKDLATNGLLIDLDYFIIGEIKGDEAAEFSLASYTGHKCWATGHGASTEDGIEKLADYIQRATGDSLEKCYKVISKLEVVVFIRNFRIEEISEIMGLQGGRLIFKKVYGGTS